MADAHLYGIRAPKNKHKEISSSTSLAFSSHLSSLISKETSKPPPARPAASSTSKSKSDIFTSHNQRPSNKKRTHDDLEDGNIAQKHKTEQDLGGSLDSNDLHRSRRKMEEKARLYAAMKRGDYVAPTGNGRDEQSAALVDFDRKWAEREVQGDHKDTGDTSSDDDDDSNLEEDREEELQDYIDEFGRTRRLPPSQIARLERSRRIAALSAQEVESMSARPSMPSNIIYGDTVQHQAFNPDEETTAKMEVLVEKRDREATPPDAVHYDATKEIRRRGTGFYAFSGDEEGRKREMEELERERKETERKRREREREKEERRKVIEQRKRLVQEARGKREAEKFLDGLEVDVSSGDVGKATLGSKEHRE